MSCTVILLIAALATWQAVEVWHHGSIFTAERERLRERGGFRSDLMLCPFCLSTWVAAAVTCILLFAAGGPIGESLLMWLPLSLAAARLANLGNDLLHGWCRTPKEPKLPDDPAITAPQQPGRRIGGHP